MHVSFAHFRETLKQAQHKHLVMSLVSSPDNTSAPGSRLPFACAGIAAQAPEDHRESEFQAYEVSFTESLSLPCG
jgi:hypothetical protein